MNLNPRRLFLKNIARTSAGYGLFSLGILESCAGKQEESNSSEEQPLVEELPDPFFQISLAQWSLHKALFDGHMDNLDFAAHAKNQFGIDAVEYVNQFFMDKANDQSYLQEMNSRASNSGVTNILIMIDGEGNLGSTDDKERNTAVENHYKWVEAAKFLECHSIRVNARGEGTAEEVASAAVDGLGSLTEFASQHDINVIVENHGGYSSDGQWLSGVIAQVNQPGCGTLPDFGNFCIEQEQTENGYQCLKEYDRYQGVKELMPYAKGVSAKANNFDAQGNCLETDYYRMLQIVKEAGYKGYIGIEYEGDELSENDGIQATLELLKRVGGEIS